MKWFIKYHVGWQQSAVVGRESLMGVLSMLVFDVGQISESRDPTAMGWGTWDKLRGGIRSRPPSLDSLVVFNVGHFLFFHMPGYQLC